MLNKLVAKALPLVPKSIVRVFANRYIAGDKLEDAIHVTKHLQEIGGMTTIDALGEFVDTKERALHEREMSSIVLDAIKEHELPTYLSIKPTSLGLGIDIDFAYQNISYIVKKASELSIFVRLDMENSPYTTKTLDTYRRLRSDGFDNVGVVIQSYMRRSEEDIRSLIDYKPSVRLCKGIYVEDEKIAFKDKEEIRNNFKKLLKLIFENGMYPGIATHDEPLISFATEYIKANNIPRDKYEFQMLLGVREARRNQLLREGHRLRVYVPFGVDWYGYSTRRMKENPEIAGQIIKAIFFKN